MSRVKLTIIIPVYNVESFIRDCLNSLLSNVQRIKEIEIILIDDGSTDHSYLICKEYSNKYSFIKIIRQKNMGQSVARNNAIKRAKGSWISFIDSDDVVTDNYVSILLDIIDNCNADTDMIMFKYKSFKSDASNLKYKANQFNTNIFKRISKSNAMYLLTASDCWGNYLWNKLYKKQILSNNLLPVGKTYEDIGTLYKYVYQTKQVYLYDDFLYFYRYRKESTVNTFNDKKGMDELEARKDQLSFFKVHNYLKAYKRAKHYLVENCLRFISHSSKNELYHLSLLYINSYNTSLKKDGLKFCMKVKIAQFSPKIWIFIKKVKNNLVNR